MMPIALRDYHIHGIIGEGGFSQVYLATHKTSNVKVAIKQIAKVIENSKNHDRYIKAEIEIMKNIRHPFICSLYEVLNDDENVYLVMEYLENGSLLDEVNINGTLNETDAAVIFAQLVMVLKYLHEECHIAHRDIKPENILIDGNHNIRVIDFGFSMVHSDHFFSTQCGSLLYSAPELVKGEAYDCRVDIWSAGVLLYAILAGHFPFDNDNASVLANQIMFSETEYPRNFSPNLKDLLQKMLTKNPENRITIDELLIHPWCKDQINSIKALLTDYKVNENYLNAALKRFEANNRRLMSAKSRALITQMLDREYMSNVIEPAFYLARKGQDLMKSSPQLKPACVSMPIKPRNYTMVAKKIYVPSVIRRNKSPKRTPQVLKHYTL